MMIQRWYVYFAFPLSLRSLHHIELSIVRLFSINYQAVVLVQDIKKDFYKKFLYEPFPVESRLPGVLHDHINAGMAVAKIQHRMPKYRIVICPFLCWICASCSEIASGTIASRQDAVEYLTWTYFFHRLAQNPSYYGLKGTTADDINHFLSELVEDVLEELQTSSCCMVDDDTDGMGKGL